MKEEEKRNKLRRKSILARENENVGKNELDPVSKHRIPG